MSRKIWAPPMTAISSTARRSASPRAPALCCDAQQARKGMQEKAEQGIWPTKCPLGYRNVTGPDGKKVIATDPAVAPLIVKLFELYARGDISLKEAARKAHAAGLVYPKSGGKVRHRSIPRDLCGLFTRP